MPRTLAYYVVWTALYTVGVLAITNRVRLDEYFYAAFYFVMLSISLFLALVLTVQFMGFDLKHIAVLVLLAFALHVAISLRVVEYLKDRECWWYVPAVMVLQGFLLPMGVLTLTSTLKADTSVGVALRLILGTYWAAQGVWAVFYVTGIAIEQNRSLWESMGDWLPASMGIAAFGMLALALWHMDNEGAREALPHLAALERTVQP